MVDEEQAEILRARGWLSVLPEDFQTAVLTSCQTVRREAGAALYHTGDDAGGLFGLAAGAIEISTPLGDPGLNLIHLGQPGFWLGAAPALTGSQRRLSASARTDCLLAHLSLTALHRMLANRPEWWRHIGALAVENMQVVIGAAADLLIRDHERRCIAVLLRLCGARYDDPLQDDRAGRSGEPGRAGCHVPSFPQRHRGRFAAPCRGGAR